MLPSTVAPATEPLLVLPDSPGPGGELSPSEGAFEHSTELLEHARQRSDELLEDAMSMWWPSAPAAPRSGAAPGGPRGAEVETRADVATQTAETPQRAPAEIPIPRPAVPAERDEEAPLTSPPAGSLFARPLDDSSLDWLDPDLGPPPRHLRRRLGRFFRRHRKPQ
jgi:hypothetical protein